MRIALLVAAAIVLASAWIGVNAFLKPAAKLGDGESVRVLVFADHYEGYRGSIVLWPGYRTPVRTAVMSAQRAIPRGHSGVQPIAAV